MHFDGQAAFDESTMNISIYSRNQELSVGSFVPVSKIFKSNDCNGEKTTRIARAPFEEASLSILLMINA